MKLKIALLAILLSIFGLTMLKQINMVNAQETTSSPITGPITYFTNRISGNISYTYYSVFRYYSAYTKPTKNVSINAVNIATSEKYTVKTDVNGNYVLNVKSGIYKVWPYGYRYSSFIPSNRYVDATKDVVNVSFVGILKYR